MWILMSRSSFNGMCP
jgi:hypothetical protein